MSPVEPSGRLVLVVDDCADNRILAAASLKAGGHRVIQAADGPAGVDAALKERPDLILLDLMMPGMDGAAVARKLRGELGCRVPIVLLTALTEAESEAKARELGLEAWMAKPFAPKQLRERVAGLLSRPEAPARR